MANFFIIVLVTAAYMANIFSQRNKGKAQRCKLICDTEESAACCLAASKKLYVWVGVLTLIVSLYGMVVLMVWGVVIPGIQMSCSAMETVLSSP